MASAILFHRYRYVRMHAYVCACVDTCIYLYVCVCTCIPVCLCVYVHVYLYVCVCTCIPMVVCSCDYIIVMYSRRTGPSVKGDLVNSVLRSAHLLVAKSILSAYSVHERCSLCMLR